MQDLIVVQNPCVPSPCGPYSECRETNNIPSCSCSPSRIGSPPYCRPECTINSDCPSNHACINEKCRDPCPGLCGLSAQCSVLNHVPSCTCISGFTGDPFANCFPKPTLRKGLVFIFCTPPPTPLSLPLYIYIYISKILKSKVIFFSEGTYYVRPL